MAKSYKQRSVNNHDFSMIPRADIPRSSFRMQKMLKTTFDASALVPILCEEILPGDTFNVHATLFVRTATPLVPMMDNMHMETFFFFVPNRLVWDNWQRFMGEQPSPGDSTSFTIPQVVSAAGGFPNKSLYDYFGLPGVGQIDPAQTISVSALPLRAYRLIYNQWFRDENLVDSPVPPKTDGPDAQASYTLLRRGKRHDYFTSCLPFVQKGTAAQLPLGTRATVLADVPTIPFQFTGVTPGTGVRTLTMSAGATTVAWNAIPSGASVQTGLTNPTGLYADLTTATAATINQLRQSFQVQKLLERDARGGTRYTEIVRSHFGVISPDARLQRPEYLGGGRSPVNIHPIEQNSATGLTGATTPLGTLSAYGTAIGSNHGFTQSFTEHGYVIGLVNIRADITYQQGIRRHWSRLTRYDFYFPVFAMLGEQAVLNKEIYARGDANDNVVFGYQERWAEYRYNPSEITGMFRSTTTGTLDMWHIAQRFNTLPTLNSVFILDDTVSILQRNFAAGSQTIGQQFLCDIFYDIKAARPLPMYSVPGLVDHF